MESRVAVGLALLSLLMAVTVGPALAFDGQAASGTDSAAPDRTLLTDLSSYALAVSDLPSIQPPSVSDPIWHELAPARQLNEQEVRLLGELAGFVDEPRLRQQVSTALVTGTCNCGCSSVRLQTDAPAIPSERVAQLSSSGRDDYFAVSSTGRPRTLRHVNVVLHLGIGRIMEFEVFHSRRGHGVQVPLERITGLQALWLS